MERLNTCKGSRGVDMYDGVLDVQLYVIILTVVITSFAV